VAVVTLLAGVGIGLAREAGADQTHPVTVPVTTKTPTSCLLALESAWKTINAMPADGVNHKAEFDASYQECLQAS
jgi:hypothetical protein